MTIRFKPALGALAAAMMLGSSTWADEAKAPAEPAKETIVKECDSCEEPECRWLNKLLLGDCFSERTRIVASGHLEQSYTWNPDRPVDRLNFGRLFDDRSNDYRLNQAVFTLERALDPQACCSDWGFKLQLMYGSDSRFVHYLGILDNTTNETVQPDLVEAFATYHLPMLTDGGVDIKAGHFVTLHGAEVIYAPGNYFYSHSYMFNFGIPFKHTGVIVTTHVNDALDVHTGLVGGINTGFDDNNDALAFHGGFGLKLLDEAVTMTQSLHVGPENDTFYAAPGLNPNGDLRVIYDAVTTVKLGEKLTSVTDLNLGRDYGFNAEWYGVAQYLIYKLNDRVSPMLRLEMWRDDDGFAAAKFGANDDFIDIQRGAIVPATNLDGATAFGGAATYTALTLGANVTPFDCVLLRPELRWDWVSGGTAPFDDSTDNNQFTAGFDVIVKF